MSLRPTAALLVAISGCFQPDLAKVTILCPSESPDCPSGLVCQVGVCMPAPEADGAATIDLAAVDAAGGDSATSVEGCRGPGAVYLGPSATGCPGAFAAGGASVLCAVGWAPCTTAAGVDQAACNAAQSFFAGEVPAYWVGTMATETCGGADFNQLLYGCGIGGRIGTEKCGGMPRVRDVAGVWSAPNGTLAGARNDDPKQGVACCKRGLTG